MGVLVAVPVVVVVVAMPNGEAVAPVIARREEIGGAVAAAIAEIETAIIVEVIGEAVDLPRIAVAERTGGIAVVIVADHRQIVLVRETRHP